MSARTDSAAIVLVAAGLAAAAFLALGDVGLNLADEGFLWHGVLRTLEGKVPIRDFQAYDPGRYYLCAAWCALAGGGILSLRAALFAVQAVALGFSLALVRRPLGNAWGRLALVPPGLLLLAWMFPLHKAFEPAAALAATWAGARLLERPDARRHLAAGLVVGVSGVFGRNLALYAGVGLLLVAACSAWKRRERRALRSAALLAAGAAAGYAPMLALLAFLPELRARFAASLADVAREGTNLPLPYPWPWRLELAGLAGWELAGRAALSLAFLIPIAAYALGLALAWRTRAEQLARRAAPLAAALVGVPFVHHVTVRSDPAHLAQVLHPALIVLLLAPAALARGRAAAWGAAVGLVLALVSVPALRASHPALIALAGGHLRERPVAGDALRLAPPTFDFVRRFEAIVASHVPAGAPILIAPFTPTLYPLSGRAAPLYTSYFLYPASAAEQEAMLRDLAARDVRWAWIGLFGLDGDERRTLAATHPILWEHLARTFEPVADERVPPGHVLLRRRAPG